MGYWSYHEYLESPVWRTIRAAVIQRQGGLCLICAKQATQVHHLDYSVSTLEGENPMGIMVLCAKCHHGAEYDQYGVKRSLEACNRELTRAVMTKVPPNGKPQKKRKPRKPRMRLPKNQNLNLVR